MNNYNITFLHTDKTIRTVKIEAFNRERAELRFYVNWGNEMKIQNIEQTKL